MGWSSWTLTPCLPAVMCSACTVRPPRKPAESGKLAFYGADAFATEPLPPQSRLRGLPGAVLTPHIAWTTKEALQRLMDITTGNLRSFLAGKGENLVNS